MKLGTIMPQGFLFRSTEIYNKIILTFKFGGLITGWTLNSLSLIKTFPPRLRNVA
jgi:hypothetical protein